MFVSRPRAFATFCLESSESPQWDQQICAETGLWIIKDKNVWVPTYHPPGLNENVPLCRLYDSNSNESFSPVNLTIHGQV